MAVRAVVPAAGHLHRAGRSGGLDRQRSYISCEHKHHGDTQQLPDLQAE